MNNPKLVVTNIIGNPINGLVRVTLERPLFDLVIQSVYNKFNKLPIILPYTAHADADGKGIRIFKIEGVDVYAKYVKTEEGYGKNLFFMSEIEAKNHYVPTVASRTPKVVVPISFSQFDLSVVATV